METTTTRLQPAIHLNGSGKDNLVAQAKAKYLAVKALETAVIEGRPHQRDWYVQGDQAWREAELQYRQDLQLVQDLKERFQTDYYAIAYSN